MARGIALFLGVFTLANLAGDLRFAGPTANLWWIDITPLPLWLARVVLALVAVALIYGRGLPLLAACAVVLVAATANTIVYYSLLAHGRIHSAFPLPLSLVIAACILFIAARRHHPESRRAIALTFVACAIVFPMLQVATFGSTDYRRPADLIVVFGARANADGTPSDALADRVRTACALYRAGLAPRLLFSGGPGAGAIDEPTAMERLATTLGVPASAIVHDPNGVNTESTARNTMALAHPPTRILAVSHFYHLPRIKMTYQRYGTEVYTVPCQDSVPSTMPYNVAREVAAFWRYYLRRVA